MMPFTSLGLAPELLRALAAQNYATPTPVQVNAIPPALAGRDLLAGAQTGTGKTAAFALPLLQRLSGLPAKGRNPRALILAPTRELAQQVNASIVAYGSQYRLRSSAVFGGVGIGQQLDTLRRGVDILVATPGRLIDHLDRRSVSLGGIDILVLDEADRMLDMGFLPAIRRILRELPRQRQTMMFSATFDTAIRQLAQQFLENPVEIQVAPRNAVADRIAHRAHPVDAGRKRDLLIELLSRDSRCQTLIFSRTKHGADRLTRQIEASGIRAVAIHGNKSQGARTRALGDFKAGRTTILVATDIAARGLDIDQLPVVINFDLPTVAGDYIHRIGRTGRAGAEGRAISLVSAEEAPLLNAIERLLGQTIEREVIEGFAPSGRPAAASPPRGARPARPQRPQARSRSPGNGRRGAPKRTASAENSEERNPVQHRRR